ncbi:MAG: FAD-binding oxidoreductase [Rhodocyclaceae bacterium]|nr:FAD-binding oxidoreductase [Rhodocyclaceae bacterium]
MTILVDALRRALGDTHVITAAEEMSTYCSDWRGRYRGDALCVARPVNTEEVAAVVRLCADAGVPVVPQGGNTGLCGGATPCGGEVVVSLGRLRRVRHLDIDNNTLTVEAGCTLAEVQQTALAANRLFPLSLAAEGSATIGGNLSTNAGGVQVLRYGNARDLTLGIEVVLPDGRIWNGLRGLRKDNTGYDLKHLFIGAEGTLGLITAAVVKLFPLPRETVTAWATVSDPAAAVALLGRFRAALGERVTAFEIIGRSALDLVLRHIPGSRDPLAANAQWQVLIELSDTLDGDLRSDAENVLAEAIAAGAVDSSVVAASETQAKALWALRENISEAQRIEGISIKHDVALPVSRIAEFIVRAEAKLRERFADVRIVCFGHIGDGNLHYNLSKVAGTENADFIANAPQVNRLVHDLVHGMEGSISAEHGLGQLKREENRRYKDPVEIELMRTVKSALDPRGLMNPGKVL